MLLNLLLNYQLPKNRTISIPRKTFFLLFILRVFNQWYIYCRLIVVIICIFCCCILLMRIAYWKITTNSSTFTWRTWTTITLKMSSEILNLLFYVCTVKTTNVFYLFIVCLTWIFNNNQSFTHLTKVYSLSTYSFTRQSIKAKHSLNKWKRNVFFERGRKKTNFLHQRLVNLSQFEHVLILLIDIDSEFP